MLKPIYRIYMIFHILQFVASLRIPRKEKTSLVQTDNPIDVFANYNMNRFNLIEKVITEIF